VFSLARSRSISANRSRISEWKRLGYDVSNLEKILQGDLETVRKELALAQMKVRRAEEMRDELF